MKVRVRWNRHTLALAAIVLGMWYAAEAQSNGAAHLLALLTAVVGALSFLHARANLRGLSVRLVGARPTAQDETTRIQVELRATWAVSPCGLELLAIGAKSSVFVERVISGSALLVELPPPDQHAGGALRIRVWSVYPLGLFTVEGVVETSWVRRIYPRAAGDLPLPDVNHSLQGDAALVSRSFAQISGGDDFAGLREWRAGDSPRHIDWRAVARGGPVMVKTWSASVQGVVVMDWKTLPLPEEERDGQIARWMEKCEADGMPYELRLPQKTIRAGLGLAHHRRCLDALAMQRDFSAGVTFSNSLKQGQGESGVSFEQSPYLPARPLLFLSLALLLAIVPLHGYIASAGLVFCALCLIWRGVLRLTVSNVVVRFALLLGGIAAVYAEYGALQGMEPGIALLLVLAGVKVLESRTPREFQVLALIGLFLSFCGILLETFLSRSVWAVAVFMLITGCMVRFRRAAPSLREPLRVTGTLFAQALPLAVLLFFIFPRGLLDLGSALGRNRFMLSGIDNILDPGSITRVALNSEVAFRVRFPDGQLPANENRYWRCLTLWECEGMRWTRGERLGYTPLARLPKRGQDIRQIIDLEAHGKTWIPALDLPLRASARGMVMFPEFDETMASPVPIRSSERIEVISRFELPPLRALPESHRDAALQLPASISPRLKELTNAWEAASQNDEQIVTSALNYLRTQGFKYTLEPGEYIGPKALDDFFLNRRTGFCEHFSAGFATLMRMAGVPSRIVVGYLGGEYSEHNGGYIIVKQSDVHAWTEVWLERYGWLRVDPTAALAPDRVNIDLRAFLEGGAEASERQRNSLWWRSWQYTRLWWDSLNYAWQNQVIDFNQESQRTVLERLGLRQSKIALLILSGIATLLAALLIAWWLHRPTRHRDPWQRGWQQVCRRLAKIGLPLRSVSEGPLDYASRVSVLRPDLVMQFMPLVEMYVAGRYGNSSEGHSQFKTLVARFKPRRLRK